MSESIPFLDLISPCHGLEDEFRAVFDEVIKTGRFIGGPMVEDFESNFAEFSEAKFCAALSSGTDAVRFALMAVGVVPGDVVLTVPNTFIATTEAITQAGAKIEFVDIDPACYNISVSALQDFAASACTLDPQSGRLISKKYNSPVSAVVPVHLYGQVADMDGIMAFAEKHGLKVVEDACQAHGSGYFSKKANTWQTAGSIGHAAAFSFYPGKNLGAMGEGGAVTTNDEGAIKMVKMLRDHGQRQKYIHQVEGYNGRLDALQAGILDIKLKRLKNWNQSRIDTAKLYHKGLKSVSQVVTPPELEGSRPVYHLYVILATERDSLQKFLGDNQIGTGLHYPVPLHLQEAYSGLNYQKGDFPISEKCATELLSLPVFPGISADQVMKVCEKVGEFYS